MHLSTTTTPTKNPTFILFERLLFARVRACINIHALYKLCCAPFHTGHDFFCCAFILYSIYLCVFCVFASLHCVNVYFQPGEKLASRNKIPINVKTNVLLMYVMKRNFFFLSQLFLSLTINSFRIHNASIESMDMNSNNNSMNKKRVEMKTIHLFSGREKLDV